MLLFHLISPMLGVPAINILLQSIVNKYLINSYCLTLVSEEPIDFKLNITFTFILVIPNTTVDEFISQLFVVSEIGCSDYIVNMRNPHKFMTAFDVVSKMGNIRRSDRKIMFLPYSAFEGRNQSLDLFSMKEASFIANLLTILPNKDTESACDTYDMITHKFGGSPNENADQLMYLDQWNTCTREFKTSSNLFPNDMSKLNGKAIKVACFTYQPYVLLNLDPTEAPNGRDGLDLRVIQEFCRWINCTIEIINEDKDKWGEIFENGTKTGAIGSVVEDRADIGITGMYPWYEEYLHLDYSAAYARASVTCIAPSARLLSSWEMPLKPFSCYMWYAVLFTFIFASIGLAVAKGCSSDGVLLTVFGVMISQYQKKASSTWPERMVSGWLLVAGLILVSAYGAGLASTFTVPKYEPSIDTIQDLVDRNMKWGATHEAWVFSLTLTDEPLIKKLVNLFQVYPVEELKRRSFTRSMAFGIEKLTAGSFAMPEYLTKGAMLDLTLMLEDFYFGHCVIIMRKSSPYTEKISTLVGRLHESGLLYAWETQVALKYLSVEMQQKVKLSRVRSDIGNIKPLSLRDVAGIFIMYGTGMMLSILLFLGERLTKK